MTAHHASASSTARPVSSMRLPAWCRSASVLECWRSPLDLNFEQAAIGVRAAALPGGRVRSSWSRRKPHPGLPQQPDPMRDSALSGCYLAPQRQVPARFHLTVRPPIPCPYKRCPPSSRTRPAADAPRRSEGPHPQRRYRHRIRERCCLSARRVAATAH